MAVTEEHSPRRDVLPSVGLNEETGREIHMSLASHLEKLQRKHGELEREIDQALTHPSVDDLDIATLKRRKLALKDEMEKLKTLPTRH